MSLSRRSVLRGAGAAIALPFLEAMMPRRAHAAEAVRRFVVMYHPNGAWMPSWLPSGEGPGWVAGPSLAPLAPVRDRVTVYTGLDLPRVNTFHAPLVRSVLSELFTVDELLMPEIVGRSLDRVVADVIGGDTRYRALALGSESSPACSGTSHCDWLAQVSWDGQDLPVVPDISLRSVFGRLFGDLVMESPSARARRQRLSQSVLDAVIGDISELEGQLGAWDRARLDEYTTAIREVERRLWLPAPEISATCPGPVDLDVTDAPGMVDAMLELAAMALECDQTRVISYMLGAGESYRGLGFLGHDIAHHSASHTDPLAYEAVTTWAVERFAWFVQRLAGSRLPDGRSLLDDTTVLFVSDMSDGLAHDHRDIPCLLAGGDLALPHGSHVRWAPGSQLHALWLSVAQGFGASLPTWGQISTPLLDLRP